MFVINSITYAVLIILRTVEISHLITVYSSKHRKAAQHRERKRETVKKTSRKKHRVERYLVSKIIYGAVLILKSPASGAAAAVAVFVVVVDLFR